MTVKVSAIGVCNNLTSGNKTDAMISEALGEMTGDIAVVDDVYNSSHWCYYARIKVTGIVKFLCENLVCLYQTYEYRCCKYKINIMTTERNVKCTPEHYHLGTVWWTLAAYLGDLAWLYFPFLLTYFAHKLSNATKPLRAETLEMGNVLNSSSEHITEDFVFLHKDKYPISFLDTLRQALCFFNVKNTILSRLLRFMIILSPLAILMTKILLAFHYNGDLIKAATSKGAFLNFNTLLVDFQLAKKAYFIIFGGPHVAVSLYILLSCIFIQIPRNLESFLARGLLNCKSLSLSPLTLSLETKCSLAGLYCKNMTGFNKLHYTLFSILLLLLNKGFWKQTLKMLFQRWSMTIYPFVKSLHPPCLSFIICIPIAIVYVIVCIFELTTMLIFYLFPIASFPFILIKAYVICITDFCHYCSTRFVKVLFYLLIPFTILALLVIWYI